MGFNWTIAFVIISIQCDRGCRCFLRQIIHSRKYEIAKDQVLNLAARQKVQGIDSMCFQEQLLLGDDWLGSLQTISTESS